MLVKAKALKIYFHIFSKTIWICLQKFCQRSCVGDKTFARECKRIGI